MAKKKKKLSGWQRRKQLKQGIKPNRVGRPQSSVKTTGKLHLDIMHNLWLDPEFPYLPDWPRDRFSMHWQLSDKASDFARSRLIPALRKLDRKGYAKYNDKTLSRYIGELFPTLKRPRRR
jgi:hypothetical protein